MSVGSRFRSSISPLTNVRAALICVPLLFGFVTPAMAHENVEPRISVSGQGTDAIAPDMAVINLTVTRQAKTAKAALDANSDAMSKVMAAMQELGVGKRDLQTANFSIQPNYTRPARNSTGADKAPRIVGYTVRNGLTVRVRNMANVGVVLDRAVTLGVNEGGNIQFTNADASDAINRARVRAVENALSKAQTLAKAAGVKLGDVQEISEHSYEPAPMRMGRLEMAMDSSSAVPVMVGENSYRVNVNIAYQIDQ
ncbi:MAG: SIMPL domain-containing protein [Halioglobus sp.]